MENERAIPAGYMTVGQAAKRLGVTVRTLQHYDREGLLSPLRSERGWAPAVHGQGHRNASPDPVPQAPGVLPGRHQEPADLPGHAGPGGRRAGGAGRRRPGKALIGGPGGEHHGGLIQSFHYVALLIPM